MSTKISNALSRRLNEARTTDPQREVPVIVTIKAGTDLAALEQNGLKIQRSFQNIPAVAGTLAAADVNALAQLDQVEKIEPDETAWAL
jgi:tripartite-type tricarboxylate transporter receptor subunit TctC